MFDFIILTTPRSGSHMLATALDSHPDIQCFGEYSTKRGIEMELPKKVKKLYGCILHMRDFIGFNKFHTMPKVIVLTRDIKKKIEGIIKSVRVDELKLGHKLHYTSHTEFDIDSNLMAEGNIEFDNVRNNYKLLTEAIKGLKDYISISYDKMTNNTNIHIIPNEYNKILSNYLGVYEYPLTPKFIKPIVRIYNGII